jgi:hypothetical protein
MIVTDSFIYIHMPKTGGTFVTKILEQLYSKRDKPGLWPRLRRRLSGNPKFISLNKHGYCFQIPSAYSHLPVFGCIRNPYDRYVSQYTFGWWLTHPNDFPGLMEHPRYPNLGFEDFVYLANEKWNDVGRLGLTDGNSSLGWHSTAFITYYCNEPANILMRAKIGSISSDEIRDSLRTQVLLETHKLNTDLYDYLIAQGFSESELSFVLTTGKIMPREGGRTANQHWERYYTPNLKSYVRERERVLFDLFPQFDI